MLFFSKQLCVPFREYVNPPNGGTSEASRVSFKAALGENTYIKCSEMINTWANNGDNTWKVSLPVSWFNGYNPHTLQASGNYQTYGQWYHRSDVYINNSVLNELQTVYQVKTESFTWYTSNTGGVTTIWANFRFKIPMQN